ncbi:Pln1 protein [Maudiozyma humilis]|uniref:Pln1 protein n=1 Tax=Maudiozyma humilis TaxID=51915 RepID=A0AAV5RUR1_MAUHU|nr:Pln1 protein [Kazachstania humilis]
MSRHGKKKNTSSMTPTAAHAATEASTGSYTSLSPSPAPAAASGSPVPAAFHSQLIAKLAALPLVATVQSRFVPAVIVGYVSLVLATFQAAWDAAAKTVFESPVTPTFAKNKYNAAVGLLTRADSLAATLIVDEGISAAVRLFAEHNGTPGLWCVYFYVDYCAHVANTLLTVLVVQPLNFAAREASAVAETAMPHLAELSSTTATISRGIQARVATDIVAPTRLRANQLIVEPTVHTYKHVAERYEQNLSRENNNVARALYSTGVDLSASTFKRVNSIVQRVRPTPQKAN